MTNVPNFIDRHMKTNLIRRFFLQEDLNFLLTNRVPRLLLTRWMGWFSHIKSPPLARLSIRVWRLFTDLDLSDARQQQFASLHDCFTRELVPGSRAIDPDPAVLCSPSDGIVGACGRVVDGMVLNDEQLRRFQDTYRPMYEETLEWIALSMVEARVSVLH